jgi:hypothetical protein
MKGIQNKKFISRKPIAIHISGLSLERKTLKVFIHAQLTRMHQLVTFGELSNDADTTGIGSMHAVASRVATSYRCQVSF